MVWGPNFITGLISIWYYTYQDPFSASEVNQFLPFSGVRKMLCFKEAPNHINKARLQVTPIDKESRRVSLSLKLKLFYSVANCLKASARNLFNF